MMIYLLASSFEAATGLPDYVAYIFLFVIGLTVGSFLNVVIHRVPNEESIIFPNSACPKCGAAIKAYDNIPLLGWLMLGGKCRNCKEPISIRYPVVELLTGISFTLVYWRLGFTPYLPVGLVFTAALIALVFIDAAHMILPNVITYPMFILALIVRLLFPIFLRVNYFSDLGHWPLLQITGYPVWVPSILGAFLGALAGGGSLWLIGEIWKRLRGVDAMGLGDVKMMFGVGALLGWRLAFMTIFMGAFFGAMVGVVVLLNRKDKTFQSQLPFGIFLGLGAFISLLFGDQLLEWYLGNFLF